MLLNQNGTVFLILVPEVFLNKFLKKQMFETGFYKTLLETFRVRKRLQA